MLKSKVNNKFDFEIANNSNLVNGSEITLEEVVSKDDLQYFLSNDKLYKVELVSANYQTKQFTIAVNNNIYQVALEEEFDTLLKSMGMGIGATKKVKELKAPMPGLVLDFQIEVGQEVAKDDQLLVLEAMKMENVIKSPTDGVIKSIEAKIGDAVEKNQILISFE